jgi:exopolysaccharide biosynthesis polyprenyl glycosylphosphotransferase
MAYNKAEASYSKAYNPKRIDTINNNEFPNINSTYMNFKRFQDIIMSIIGLIITIPIILIAAILIKIETPGKAFYTQERVGHNGRKFKVVKLRSMYVDAEKLGPQWANKDDARVTRIGSFIRKTRIDELPQLFNVFIGDMSMIGPRPERPIFVSQFNKEIPKFQERLLVKPGLTGWAQVNGGYDISPELKLKYDLEYMENIGFMFELKILLLTVKVVISGEGAR